MSADAVVTQRKREALRHALGAAILHALADDRVVEVLANPDGRLIVDTLGDGRQDTGTSLSSQDRERVIRLVAEHVGEPITRDDPRLAGVLPTGERFQGFLPPVAPEPTFSIRKRSTAVWSLDDYVSQGALSAKQAATLRDAVNTRQNIVICGGTGSGKTTLANALLAEPAFAEDRVFLIEDVPELRCSAWDLVGVLTRRHPTVIGVGDLVRDALRMRPDRIVIGEMRDGATTLEAMKAWNTGHPGGLSTLHANSAFEAIDRLEDLLSEVVTHVPRRTLAQAIDLIVHIRRTREGRRVEDILRIDGLDVEGRYNASPLNHGR